MKILFSLTYYTPYVSGLTLYVKRLASTLVKNGYDVSVISYQYKKELKEEERIENVRIVRAKPLLRVSKGFFSFDWGVRSWYEVQKHDVVFVNLPQFEAIIPALWARIFGKKLITIYHCEVVLPRSFGNKVVEYILALSHLVSLFLSDVIVTYTDDFARHSRILSLFREKVNYIYPPISKLKTDKRVQKMIRDKIGRNQTYIIGIAARLAAEKGIEYVLESIPIVKSKFKSLRPRRISLGLKNAKLQLKIQNFKILIAGPMAPVGEEKYKNKILKLVGKYKEYVVFLGELKEEEMGAFYSLLDVLVLPSVNSTEAFGMVQVEAMMMGVPVVVSDLPGVRVPVQKTGMGRLVPPRNSQKLGEVIIEILKNKKKYIRKREAIEKEFALGKTISFYESLLR